MGCNSAFVGSELGVGCPFTIQWFSWDRDRRSIGVQIDEVFGGVDGGGVGPFAMLNHAVDSFEESLVPQGAVPGQVGGDLHILDQCTMR
jgi:hypothetical protein